MILFISIHKQGLLVAPGVAEDFGAGPQLLDGQEAVGILVQHLEGFYELRAQVTILCTRPLKAFEIKNEMLFMRKCSVLLHVQKGRYDRSFISFEGEHM